MFKVRKKSQYIKLTQYLSTPDNFSMCPLELDPDIRQLDNPVPVRSISKQGRDKQSGAKRKKLSERNLFQICILRSNEKF